VGVWGLGVWVWGFGFGVLAQTPNPQSPIPNLIEIIKIIEFLIYILN
jgi:hypothetical protein